MHVPSEHTWSEEIKRSSWLDQNLLSVISEQEIQNIVRKSCEVYGPYGVVMTQEVVDSYAYYRVIRGTIWDFVAFLRSFENKSPCGVAHEAWRRLEDGRSLEPERCKYRDGYSGCAHHELNWVLLAEALGAYLGQEISPEEDLGKTQEIALHRALYEVDESARRVYGRANAPTLPDGKKMISPDIHQKQYLAWDRIRERLHDFSHKIEQIYGVK